MLTTCELFRQATELVEFFRFFAVPISICFSCRHYPFVALEGGKEVCVEQENEQDIENYINDKISTHVQRVGIAQVIQNGMVSRSQGNFQWVVLVLPRVLKMHKSRKSLLAIQIMIRNIPAELNELYTNLLKFVDEYERVQSLRLLQWISFAFRPLTLSELRFALAMGADTPYKSLRECQSSELYVDTDEDMERIVCDLSKGLAEVVGNHGERVAQFVHQSVEDFLLEQGFQSLDHTSTGTVVGRGHFWLSRSCVKYFLMKEIRDSSISTQNYFNELRRIEESFYMLDYSLDYLVQHVKYVDVANMPQDDLLALDSEHTDRISLPPWFAVYQQLQIHSDQRRHIYSELNGGTLLHAAANYNLIGVVKAILARIPRADQKDQGSRTPLFTAAEKGHIGVVEVLIGRDDVDLNSKCNGHTPLSIAAKMGHIDLVEMLINRDDVDVNSKCNGHTPLYIAVKMGHEVMVEMLMNRDDVDVNSKDCDGETPLSVASTQAQKAIVKMLINKEGVDVDSKNSSGETPLSLAATMGHEAIVKLLVKRNGVNVDSKSYDGNTPLSLAAANSNKAVVKMLMNRDDVNVNSMDQEGYTPLHKAVSGGHKGTVRMLMSREDVNVNSKNYSGETPIFIAAARKHEIIVKILMNRDGIDLDTKNRYGDTPLTEAARSRHPSIAKVLLERSVALSPKEWQLRMALSVAAGHGHYEMVKLLHQHHANTDSKDSEGRTPLSYAASCGVRYKVVKLLRHQHIDLNTKSFKPPLAHVASNGHYKIVKLLLQENANADSRDREGRTPLSYAAICGHYEIVKLLLRYNANADPRDSKGRTPLSYAASGGHDEIVKLLLEKSSNADQKDNDGRTPFSYAVCNGHKEVVEAFAERGDVDINSKDISGRSPLSWALINVRSLRMFAQLECVAVVKFLLKQNHIVVTEEDKYVMEAASHCEDPSVSQTEEEESEEEESEEEEDEE